MSVNSHDDNVMKIMIATDSHLGYKESDAERGNDSFNTFEEVLQLGVEHLVDFILLSGDLFHEANPSTSCLLKCFSLLRKYCLGDKPVAIEILSDQAENFKESINKSVNYEDPNINVSFPVFSIHGNHDDPTGESGVSSLDILTRMGLMNYIGKWSDLTHVKVSPILMQKGSTKLAIYGLSYLKDHRLARLFRDGKVEMATPRNTNEWFNILAIHQNRAERGYSNYIPEDVLPDFLDLVIWGHEHNCRIIPEWNKSKKFHVTQPGSSVATSLANGESIQKHCGLITVRGKEFQLRPLPLETVRPFLFQMLVLSEQNLDAATVNQHEIVQKIVNDKIEHMLKEVERQITGHSKQPQLPLLRLSVFFEHDNQQFNAIRFGQQFSERVANPQDVILLKREKMRDRKANDLKIVKEGIARAVKELKEEITVESLLEKIYSARPEDEQLSALSVPWLCDSVRSFTQRNDDYAIEAAINAQKVKYMEHLMKSNALIEGEIMSQISFCKLELFTEKNNKLTKILETTKNDRTKKQSGRMTAADSDRSSSDSDNDPLVSKKRASPSPTPRGRGRGKGSRGGRGSRGANKPRGRSQATLEFKATTAPSPKKAFSRKKNWLTNMANTQSSSTNGSKTRTSKVVYISDSD